MSSEAHGGGGYNAAELRDAMTFFGLPGRSDIEAISELDDLRGDGIDVNTQGHGQNLGDVNEQALGRARNCTCNYSGPNGDFSFGCRRPPRWFRDYLHMSGDFGVPHFEGDELSGADVIGWDDEPSAFAADYFGGDETLAGEWAEGMLAADVLGEDDLYALGWDPFKSIKKAVRPLTKTVKAATKAVGKVTSTATRLVGKVPVVGKVAASGLRTIGSVSKAATKLNPISILTNPRAAIAAQIAAAKSAVATATQTVSVAKQLAKSPVVKSVVGGAAIVFPPLGVPAAAALATAAAVANAVDSKLPQARAAAQKVIENTARLAQSGDKGAEIALSQIATQKQALLAKRMRTAPAGAKRLVFDVNRQGRITRTTL